MDKASGTHPCGLGQSQTRVFVLSWIATHPMPPYCLPHTLYPNLNSRNYSQSSTIDHMKNENDYTHVHTHTHTHIHNLKKKKNCITAILCLYIYQRCWSFVAEEKICSLAHRMLVLRLIRGGILWGIQFKFGIVCIPNLYVEALTPNTSECDFIWR